VGRGIEERIRGLIVMQAEGYRSTMVAEMRADFEAHADAERTAIADLRARADMPIRLPPGDVITRRVLGVRALAESPDVAGARAQLHRHFKGGQITLTPDAGAYVARAEFNEWTPGTDGKGHPK
jgi:hypothetical protein